MTIRKAKKSETRALANVIEEIIISTPYYSISARADEVRRFTKTKLDKLIARSDTLIYIAEIENEIVGFRIGSIYAGVFWSEWGGVIKKQRNKGLSQAIFKRIEDELIKRNVHKMWCDARTNNQKSIKSLKSSGFRRVGTLKKHWWGLDFYLWEKTL